MWWVVVTAVGVFHAGSTGRLMHGYGCVCEHQSRLRSSIRCRRYWLCVETMFEMVTWYDGSGASPLASKRNLSSREQWMQAAMEEPIGLGHSF